MSKIITYHTYNPQNNAALYELYSNENLHYTRGLYDIYVAIMRIL